jgi:hypothetical protein
MMIYFNLIRLFKGLPLHADALIRLQLAVVPLRLQPPMIQFVLPLE